MSLTLDTGVIVCRREIDPRRLLAGDGRIDSS